MQTLERTCPEKNEAGFCRKQGIRCYIEQYRDCKIYQESVDEKVPNLIKCSNCGEDLTSLILKMSTPVIESLVKMRLSHPEIRDIQIQSSSVTITCPKCKNKAVYPVDLDKMAEDNLERFK